MDLGQYIATSDRTCLPAISAAKRVKELGADFPLPEVQDSNVHVQLLRKIRASMAWTPELDTKRGLTSIESISGNWTIK
jgi:hypothetical protein